MGERLSWQEIEQRYDKEWVELTDVDWPEEEIDPRSGIVRVHAKTREEFDKLLLANPPQDSAIVFVGEPELPPNEIISTINLISLKPLNL